MLFCLVGFFIKLHALFLLPNNPTKTYYSFCSYGRFSGGPTDRTSKMGSCSSLSQAQQNKPFKTLYQAHHLRLFHEPALLIAGLRP